MRSIERIGFVSGAGKEGSIEWVIVGFDYWDLGKCEVIRDIGDKTYACHFNRKGQHVEFFIDNPKFRVYKHEGE